MRKLRVVQEGLGRQEQGSLILKSTKLDLWARACHGELYLYFGRSRLFGV